MLLSELMAGITAEINGDAQVSAIAHDSRRVSAGTLFVCLPGTRVDGHDFADKAMQAGASALIVQRFLPDVPLPQAKVEDARAAYAIAAGNLYGNPARAMKLIGVTGTSGKTSTTILVQGIAAYAGYKVGVIGTMGSLIDGRPVDSDLTTPDPGELHALFARMRDEGVQLVVMEVSAHALDLRKLEGLRFDAGIYTNLSQDHLDYFHTMQAYRDAKKRFFQPHRCLRAVINLDDEQGALMREGTRWSITYGCGDACQVRAEDVQCSSDGNNFTLQLPGHALYIQSPLVGAFNVYNALAAAAACYACGMPASAIQMGLNTVSGVPGRMESIPNAQRGFSVLVDYSHKPDALEKALRAVREFTQGRVIAVFGCGGDRDNGKRPIMGRLAGQLADYCVLTSDNPRTEDPMAILAMVEAGIKQTDCPYEVIEPRAEAIGRALAIAQPGDTVMIAGKGHETYQEIHGVKHHFDDREVAREWLKAHPPQDSTSIHA